MATESDRPGYEGLAGRDCVPYFDNERAQIKFEFAYLVLLLLLAIAALISVRRYGDALGLTRLDAVLAYALVGGFLGGWVYDTKWFYRVTARGKSDQYKFLWQSHKFYWRVFTPFLSCLVAFATFMLLTSDAVPFAVKNRDSGRLGFAVCFLLGYFSDLVLSRLAAWAENMLPVPPKK